MTEETVTLKIWDFGGQDIYHGTHALFLKSRAIFPLVWTPEAEAAQFHEHGGFTFRNHPLGYWLAYVRALGAADSPVLVIQSQCDEPEREWLRPPVSEETLAVFPFKKVLHYSARKDRGRGALNDALSQAVQWLRDKHGVDKIGRGRAEVKARLEKRHATGKKLVSQKDFLALCEKVGNVSSPSLLLDYLHNIGTVFYRRGLFGDAIILDQAWALEAVYAVFDRDSKAFKNIERYGGRFRRSDLAQWVWQKHGTQEQELFLSFMRQCGICFVIREGNRDIEAEFVAPDLLPRRDDPEIAMELRQKWDKRCDAEATLVYELLPPGLMRSLIAKIGEEGGLAAEYWREGFYFYDEKTGGKALVEQRWTEGWTGEIHVQTQGKQAQLLLDRVLKFIDERHAVFGARPQRSRAAARLDATEPGDAEPSRVVIKPAYEPSGGPEYFVSYAWGDDTPKGKEREAFVDRLCGAATARGITIIRDKTAMRFGDSISKFMERIGRAGRDGRVFVVLSDKYLRSPYCMSELFDVWRNCREEDAEFIARTRVFTLSCARIAKPIERGLYAVHWRKALDELQDFVKEHGQLALSDKDNADYRRMTHFANETANILTLVQDVLRPRSFDEFIAYGFDDPPEAPG